MDIMTTPPRADVSTQTSQPAARVAQDAVSVRPETSRPVMGASEADKPTPGRSSEFQPLDVVQVGDNDDIPVPPEPPRESAVLAIIAAAQEPDDGPGAEADAKAEEKGSDAAAPADSPTTAIPALLKDIEDGPVNPTVDIRS